MSAKPVRSLVGPSLFSYVDYWVEGSFVISRYENVLMDRMRSIRTIDDIYVGFTQDKDRGSGEVRIWMTDNAEKPEVEGHIVRLAPAANDRCDVERLSRHLYDNSERALKKREEFLSQFSGFRLVRLERVKGEVGLAIGFTSNNIPEEFPRGIDLTRKRLVEAYDVDEGKKVVSEVSRS